MTKLLSITYKHTDGINEELENEAKAIVSSHKGYYSGSGYSFFDGIRDLVFEFDDNANLKDVCQELQEAGYTIENVD